MNLLKRCSQLFFTQMFAYCVVCISFIAMNRGNYLLTFVTDVGCGLNSYFLIRRVAQAKDGDHIGMVSYIMDGATGSIIAMWLTKIFHV